jgi:hypothetical protein
MGDAWHSNFAFALMRSRRNHLSAIRLFDPSLSQGSAG